MSRAPVQIASRAPRVDVRAAMVAAAVMAALAHPTRAEAGDPHVRVIAQSAPVRSGPGGDYREIATAERGEVYRVLRRGTRGYWFEIELEDATTGWIFGDLIFPFEVAAEAPEPGWFSRARAAVLDTLFGPPAAEDARVALSASGGALAGEGLFVLRPAVLIDSYFALEGFAGTSPRSEDNLFLGGVGGTLRLAPSARVAPYVHAGIGGAYVRPAADNFTEDPRALAAVSTGAGLEMSFARRITARVSYRNWTLFDPDEASSAQEVSGGLAIFF